MGRKIHRGFFLQHGKMRHDEATILSDVITLTQVFGNLFVGPLEKLVLVAHNETFPKSGSFAVLTLI